MMMRSILILSFLMALASGATAVVDDAKSPEENGLAVAREVDRRDLGFGDFEAELVMTLRNRHGEESTREVAGTAFLTFGHKSGDDDQWLYLPALKRVKRIASNNKSGPFMGSEFAYEDISSQEVEEYDYKYLRSEDVDGVLHHVIEQYPLAKKSGYSRQVVWIDQDEYRPQKVEFFDRKDSLLKTLRYSGYQQYLGSFWRPDEMHMENHQTGKSTLLEWGEYRFQLGLAERDFDQNSLARAR
jgi:outer membrane lipoprotein-sorting protein